MLTKPGMPVGPNKLAPEAALASGPGGGGDPAKMLGGGKMLEVLPMGLIEKQFVELEESPVLSELPVVVQPGGDVAVRVEHIGAKCMLMLVGKPLSANAAPCLRVSLDDVAQHACRSHCACNLTSLCSWPWPASANDDHFDLQVCTPLCDHRHSPHKLSLNC